MSARPIKRSSSVGSTEAPAALREDGRRRSRPCRPPCRRRCRRRMPRKISPRIGIGSTQRTQKHNETTGGAAGRGGDGAMGGVLNSKTRVWSFGVKTRLRPPKMSRPGGGGGRFICGGAQIQAMGRNSSMHKKMYHMCMCVCVCVFVFV